MRRLVCVSTRNKQQAASSCVSSDRRRRFSVISFLMLVPPRSIMAWYMHGTLTINSRRTGEKGITVKCKNAGNN